MNYLGFRDMSYTIIAGIIILMNMIIQVPMGIAADHFGRKPVYKVVLPISAVLLFAFAFVPPGNVWGTLLFGGGGFTLYFTLKLVVTSWMQDLCPPDQRGSLLIYNNLADILPMTPGAFIGGWLADAFTAGENALFHPVMYIAAAIVICFSLPVFLRTPETIQRKK
jgi:MFS family permease